MLPGITAVFNQVAAGGGPYALTHSILLNGSGQSLSGTLGTPTNSLKWTLAFFLKRTSGTILNAMMLFCDPCTATNDVGFGICGSDGTLPVGATTGNGNGLIVGWKGVSSPVVYPNSAYLENTPSIWTHIMLAVDATQATPSTRCRIYRDGSEVGYGVSQIQPPQNAIIGRINTAVGHQIGAGNTNVTYAGQFADINFVDGQQLTPSSFTTGTGSGTTHPAAYAGSYGANGFHLKFDGSDGSDTSGNSNNWTLVGGPAFSTDVPV